MLTVQAAGWYHISCSIIRRVLLPHITGTPYYWYPILLVPIITGTPYYWYPILLVPILLVPHFFRLVYPISPISHSSGCNLVSRWQRLGFRSWEQSLLQTCHCCNTNKYQIQNTNNKTPNNIRYLSWPWSQEKDEQITNSGEDSGSIVHGVPNWFYRGKFRYPDKYFHRPIGKNDSWQNLQEIEFSRTRAIGSGILVFSSRRSNRLPDNKLN